MAAMPGVDGGYWLTDANGDVAAFGPGPGGACIYPQSDGSGAASGGADCPSTDWPSPGLYSFASGTDNFVGIEATPDGGGYWLVNASGGVLTYGDAVYVGSIPGSAGVSNLIGLVPQAGDVYSLVAGSGQIYLCQISQSGPTEGAPTCSPPVAVTIQGGDVVSAATPTPDRKGALLLASDGDIYAEGDATLEPAGSLESS